MNPEEQPVGESPQQEPKGEKAIHTYQDDLARAMNVTDAQTVQALMQDARERELVMNEEKKNEQRRGWYVAGGIILVLLAFGVISYGIYHYRTLTVPVQESVSVGAFPSTAPIAVPATNIRTVVQSLTADANLASDKPTLVQLVTDTQTLLPLSKNEFFSFIEANPSEPFVASIDAIRLGIVRIDTTNIPFIIASVPDAETASKEFLIAEPDMLRIFYRPLGIDLAAHTTEVGKGFESTYLYNIPVRTLSAATSDGPRITLLYGYATDHTIVITTDPAALKAVYEELIRQR